MGIGDGIGEAITGLIVICLLIGGVIVGGIWGFTSFNKKDYIESTKPIIPVKILTTDGKKVDTLYRYYKK